MEKHDELVKQISKLLSELNDTLIETGVGKLVDDKRINIPSYKINNASKIITKYSLDELFRHKYVKDNIAYSIMLHHALKYFWQHFHLWGVVGDMFLKNLIINHVAIIEALLYGSLIDLHEDCKIDFELCKHARNCPVYIKSKSKMNFTNLLNEYELKIFFYDKEIFEKILELKARRDEIHIHNINYHIFHKPHKFKDEINASETTLEFLGKNLPTKIREFKTRRKSECRIGHF